MDERRKGARADDDDRARRRRAGQSSDNPYEGLIDLYTEDPEEFERQWDRHSAHKRGEQ